MGVCLLLVCSKVLLLEFGEDLEDAFTLMEVLWEHSLPLLQASSARAAEHELECLCA